MGKRPRFFLLNATRSQIFDLKEKYQILLLKIEALKNSLEEEISYLDEKSLREAIDSIFAQASDIAKNLQDIKSEREDSIYEN